ASMIGVLFIIVIALAGLGKVVVKALGGEEVKYPPGSRLVLEERHGMLQRFPGDLLNVPAGTRLEWGSGQSMTFSERFQLRLPPTAVNWEKGAITLPA